jgi:hypothetical protein
MNECVLRIRAEPRGKLEHSTLAKTAAGCPTLDEELVTVIHQHWENLVA